MLTLTVRSENCRDVQDTKAVDDWVLERRSNGGPVHFVCLGSLVPFATFEGNGIVSRSEPDRSRAEVKGTKQSQGWFRECSVSLIRGER